MQMEECMTDYILREAAIEEAIDAVDEWDGGYNPHRAAQIRDGINAIPAADVRSVVRGKWVFCGGTWEGANIFKCSECGKSVYHEETNYCPNCGAWMEES
jgi:hypothetical protein